MPRERSSPTCARGRKEAGLWAPHIGPEAGGHGPRLPLLRLPERGDRAQLLGPARLRVPGAGRREQRDPARIRHAGSSSAAWLAPLVAGEVRSFFGMTEPEVSGADPTSLESRAAMDGGDWVIDGHKWFSTGADGAAFGIVMAVTDPGEAPHRRDVADHRPGRHARASRWCATSRCSGTPAAAGTRTARCASATSACRPRTCSASAATGFSDRPEAARPGPHPPRHALARPDAAGVRPDVLLQPEPLGVRRAAGRQADDPDLDRRLGRRDQRLPADDARRRRKIDRGEQARVEVSALKFFSAQVLHDVIDRAVQTHGALGVSGDSPLAEMYLDARFARISTAPTRCTGWWSRARSSRRYRAGDAWSFE